MKLTSQILSVTSLMPTYRPPPEYGAQVDLAVTKADPAAPGYPDCPIMKQVLSNFQVMVFASRGCIHFALLLPAKA